MWRRGFRMTLQISCPKSVFLPYGNHSGNRTLDFSCTSQTRGKPWRMRRACSPNATGQTIGLLSVTGRFNLANDSICAGFQGEEGGGMNGIKLYSVTLPLARLFHSYASFTTLRRPAWLVLDHKIPSPGIVSSAPFAIAIMSCVTWSTKRDRRRA